MHIHESYGGEEPAVSKSPGLHICINLLCPSGIYGKIH